MSAWESVIGLEVHCQLETRSKMFSACPVDLAAAPNTVTDPYTWGLPGTLPVPNEAAVRHGIALALALGCELRPRSRFARKHYFYPDLPKGYQITQSDEPYAVGGAVEFETEDGPRRARLVRIHFEEDAGKNVHLPGEDQSLVDFDRAGAPLLEIVGEPDLRTPAEAAAYLRELRAIVRALGLSRANMEEGTLRCDANVSIRRPGTTELGTRCEIKNLNSFRFLALAIAAEVRRQIDVLESGGTIVRATLTYDVDRDRTRILRTKEDAADYRYLPDPDLPPLEIPAAWIEHARAHRAELPAARRARWRGAGMGDGEVALLSSEPELGDYVDRVIAAGIAARTAAAWVTGELVALARADGREPHLGPVTPDALAELIAMVDEQTLSARAAKQVLAQVWREGGRPREVAERSGLGQVSDPNALAEVVREVIAANPQQAAQLRAGKEGVRGWLVGQIMKASRGRANPHVVQQMLDQVLAEEP